MLRRAGAMRSATGFAGSPLRCESIEHRLMLSADPFFMAASHAVTATPALQEVQAPVDAPIAPLIAWSSALPSATGRAEPAARQGVEAGHVDVAKHEPSLAASFDRARAVFDLASATGAVARVVMTTVGANAGTAPLVRIDAATLLEAGSATDGTRFDNVYDGIDLVYHRAADGALEYDWVVGPQADPDTIRMSFSGAFGIEIEADGDLALHTLAGDLIEHAPVLYQDVDGVRQAVEGHFMLLGGGPGDFEVGFEVGLHDSSRELVIDPALSYSTYLGGSGNDAIYLTGVDDAGNTYVLGNTNSPSIGGVAGSANNFQTSVFWAKYNPQGQPLYAHAVPILEAPPKAGDTSAAGLIVAPDGTVYVMYTSNDYDFDVLTHDSKLHLVTLGADGAPVEDLVLLQSSPPLTPGSAIYDVSANGMTFGPNGSIYISASTLASAGGGATVDSLVIKVQPGAGIVFKQSLGIGALVMGVDAQGNIYVATETTRNDLPVSPDALKTRASNAFDRDIYLMTLDPTGKSVLFATYVGGSSNDFLGSMLLDPAHPGGVLLVGATNSADFPMTAKRDGFQTAIMPSAPDRATSFGSLDGFVTELDLPNMRVVASTFLGGSGVDELTGIALDADGNVYISGQTTSVDFPTVDPLFPTYAPGAAILSFAFPYDMVVAKLPPTLASLLFSTYLGGSGHDSAQTFLNDATGGPKIRVDGSGTIHLAGTSSSTDFPTLNAAQPDFAGGINVIGFNSQITHEASDGVIVTIAQRGTVLGGGVRATAGTEINPAVAFFVAGANANAADFEALIDWGDGTPQSAGRIEPNGAGKGSFRVLGTHAYTQAGAYPVLVNVHNRVDGSLSPLTNVDLTHRAGNQIAPAMAQDPTFLNRLVTVATQEAGVAPVGSAPGIVLSISNDGGRSWAPRLIANGTDKLPPAESSPDALFDAFGNLYITYLTQGGAVAVLLTSKDGGRTFGESALKTLGASGVGAAPGRPRLACNASRNEVWFAVMDSQAGALNAAGAVVSGLGQIDFFAARTTQVGDGAGSVDIASGGEGAVAFVWDQTEPGGGMKLRGVIDPDGLGDQPEGALLDILTARLTGAETVATLPGVPLRPGPVLAWDTSTGPHRGRLYVAYQDLTQSGGTTDTGNLDAYVTWSDGTDFTEPVRLTAASSGQQLLPTVAVDPSSGTLAAGWYDTEGSGDPLQMAFTVAASADGGVTFSRSARVADQASSPAGNAVAGIGKTQGPGGAPRIVFSNRQLRALWADNSAMNGENRFVDAYEIAERSMGVIDVAPAPVKLRPVPISAVKGSDFTGTVATFTVDDPARLVADFTAMIEWGDGTKTSGAISQAAGPGMPFTITGNHVYAEVGAYPIWVTVTDAKGGPRPVP